MNKLWDKFLLGLCCCAFMLAEGTDPSNITTLLLAVICSAIFQIKPSSAVAYLSVIAYSSLCIFSKEALILAPLVLYDAFCTKFYPAMVLTFIGVLANIFTLGKDIFPLVALFLVSFTISSRSVLNEKLTKMLINTRDNSKELTTQLVEKNKAMQRNQDYEIYLATLKERNRIAREIHDNVGHMLTRSILQLGALSVMQSKPVFSLMASRIGRRRYGALKLMMLPSISRSGLPFTAIQIVSSNFSVKAIIQL